MIAIDIKLPSAYGGETGITFFQPISGGDMLDAKFGLAEIVRLCRQRNARGNQSCIRLLGEQPFHAPNSFGFRVLFNLIGTNRECDIGQRRLKDFALNVGAF